MPLVMKSWDYYLTSKSGTDRNPRLTAVKHCVRLCNKFIKAENGIGYTKLIKDIVLCLEAGSRHEGYRVSSLRSLFDEFIRDLQLEFDTHLMDTQEYLLFENMIAEHVTGMLINHRWDPAAFYQEATELVCFIKQDRMSREFRPLFKSSDS